MDPENQPANESNNLDKKPPIPEGLIRNLRKELALSQEELAEILQKDVSTIRKWELGNYKTIRPYNLRPLKKWIAENQGYLKSSNSKSIDQYGFEEEQFSTETLLKKACEIDEETIFLYRHIEAGSPWDKANKHYSSILNGSAYNSTIHLKHLLGSLQNNDSSSSPLEEVDLNIEVSDSFDEIAFSFDDRCHSIKHPSLLWSCNCRVSKELKSPKKDCPIHRNKWGKLIENRFTKGVVKITHRNTRIHWKQLIDLWPPSIDSILMAETLRQDGFAYSHYNSMLDIGCGTGFLGITLSQLNPKINELFLSDWLLTPLIFSKFNVGINTLNPKLDIKYRLGLGKDWLFNRPLESPVDVAVCNPPYLPLLDNFPELGKKASIAGTALLEHLIENVRSIGKDVFVSFSNFADTEARRAAERSNVELSPIGNSHLIPFRVTHAYKVSGYVNALEDRGLEKRPETDFPYWHRIQTYKIEY